MNKLTGVNLDDIRKRTVSAQEYFEGLSGKYVDMMIENYQNYKVDQAALEKLKDLVKDVTCVVFGATWCKDCRAAIPVLRHLNEKIGLEVRIFKDVKTAPLDPDHQWKIPPSPPEMEEWNITHIPWIILFDKDGNEIGTIIEKPQVKETLEAEILYRLEK